MKIKIFQSLRQISENDWVKITPADFPFASYQFLSALEVSGCLGPRTGWSPVYFTAWNNQDLIGGSVAYLKTNSYGEYIFDFAWAQAHESMGASYYPKVVMAVPFTPATGPKVLLAPELSADLKLGTAAALLGAVEDWSVEKKASSSHALFLTKDDLPFFSQAGFFIRHSFQFHWQNKGYKSFESFTESLRGKRRKEIRRERAMVTDSHVTIERLTGTKLKPYHAELMYEFYLSTIDKMQGMDYLTLDFFKEIFSTMADQILFVLASNSDGAGVAGALCFFKGSALFGRNWGCLEEYKGLHFELCYYQGIEFAIEKNLKIFEAGAQGEHKFQRGFMPTLTYSAHVIKNPRLNLPIQDYVGHEKIQIEQMFAQYLEHSPFASSV